MIPILFDPLGIKPDYTPSSLDKVEKVIDSMFPEGHKPMESTLIPFGFYLGEVIVQNIPGAHWDIQETTKYLNEIAVVVPQAGDDNHIKIMPFVRISKFWSDRTDGLSVFYRMISRMALGRVDLDSTKPGEWVHFPNGDSFRVTKEKKEK